MANDDQRPVLIKDSDEGLVINKVSKSFSGRPVVREVEFQFKCGEAIGLLGPNGSGKTTLFYTIIGLIKPDSGSIVLDGEDITDLPIYKRSKNGIGYLPQEASIFRGLTVEDNIRAILEILEEDNLKVEEEIDHLLKEFDIDHLRRTPALSLSGGERRRVEIARCLASHPKYILLDEPFAGIDPIAVGEIRELVSHLKERGVGVLITDHNVRETLSITDRSYLLYDGKVLFSGTSKELSSNEKARRLYLGDSFKY